MYHKTFEEAYPVEMPDVVPESKPPAARRRGLIAAVVGDIRARMAREARRQRFIREFRGLDKLSDRQLRDVGMHRGDVSPARLRELLKDPANWDV